MKTPVVYYAHCMALYNTAQEDRDEEILRTLGFTVLNPNAAKHQAGAKCGGMDYFKPIVRECNLLAFRALPDGAIPAGVFLEIGWAREAGLPVIELPSSVLRRGITREQTREYIREVGAWCTALIGPTVHSLTPSSTVSVFTKSITT